MSDGGLKRVWIMSYELDNNVTILKSYKPKDTWNITYVTNKFKWVEWKILSKNMSLSSRSNNELAYKNIFECYPFSIALWKYDEIYKIRSKREYVYMYFLYIQIIYYLLEYCWGGGVYMEEMM